MPTVPKTAFSSATVTQWPTAPDCGCEASLKSLTISWMFKNEPFHSHFTSIELYLDVLFPSLFSAVQLYCPESEDWMELKSSCGSLLRGRRFRFIFSLYQVYLAAGLASLLQVRVTELPSTISPEGLTDTEEVFGRSAGQDVKDTIHYIKKTLYGKTVYHEYSGASGGGNMFMF